LRTAQRVVGNLHAAGVVPLRCWLERDIDRATGAGCDRDVVTASGAAAADQGEIAADRQSAECERCVSRVRQHHRLRGAGGAYLLRSETKAGGAQARLRVDNCKAKRDQLWTPCRVVSDRDGGSRGRWAEDLRSIQEAYGNRAGLSGL